jgi:hypothetical protein
VNKDPSRPQYELLQDTAYGSSDYYSLNFNSIPSAIITLICLLRVSGWDTFAMAMVKVKDDSSARLFFILWYLIGVLLLMNIVATLFISGFVVEAATHEQQSHALESEPQHSNIPLEEEQEGQQTRPSMTDGENNGLSQGLLPSPMHVTSLQRLASRLTQFMSPAAPPPSPALESSSGYHPPLPMPSKENTDEDRGVWNQDISRLTKGSAIRDITTAREGGKLYMISLPQYGASGGNISVDSMGQDEQEVGKKFMQRIHSLYATGER